MSAPPSPDRCRGGPVPATEGWGLPGSYLAVAEFSCTHYTDEGNKPWGRALGPMENQSPYTGTPELP